MPTLRLAACLLFLALIASSCRDDFALEGDYQDIPVAYAYLNAQEDRHFVRLEKAFLESGGNANEIAGIADSIYYASGAATVTVTNNRSGASTELERVDAQDFGEERQNGIFATDPNIAYTFQASDLTLEGGDEIEVRVERPGEPDAVASTVLLPEQTIVVPSDGGDLRVDDPDRAVRVVWQAPPPAAIFDIRFVFHLRELFPDNPADNRNVDLEYIVVRDFVPGSENQTTSGRVNYSIPNLGFYQFLGNSLEPDSRVRRRLLGVDLVISAAGEEVLEEQRLAGANAGLTSSQSLPRYTNLSNGLGLITSRTTAVREDLQFDGESMDSLQDGRFTRDLGF